MVIRIFGDKNKFAIEYNFKSAVFNDTYGYIVLWVNGVNLCSYNQNQQCEDDLYYIIDWFCDKIEYVLGYDLFPLPVKGNTALELVDNANKFESDDMVEFDLWYSAKSRWILNHCWFIARGGGILPCLYFRRIERGIELCWDNEFWEKEGVKFDSLKGAQTIELRVFRKIITEFLFSILSDLEGKIEKCQIEPLKKRINILNE